MHWKSRGVINRSLLFFIESFFEKGAHSTVLSTMLYVMIMPEDSI